MADKNILKAVIVKKKHFEEIDSWYHERGIEPPERSYYPKTGYIIEGLAAGFLYKFEGVPIGFLDGYISNPKSNKYDRGRALDFITELLIKWSEMKSIKRLLATSKHPMIKERALRVGFKEMTDYQIYIRGI
jgi:hypothetical protein